MTRRLEFVCGDTTKLANLRKLEKVKAINITCTSIQHINSIYSIQLSQVNLFHSDS